MMAVIYMPQSESVFNFSIILLIVMLVALTFFVGILLAKLRKLKDYITKEKVDIGATIISIVVLAMCVGGIIVFLFCMNAFVK